MRSTTGANIFAECTSSTFIKVRTSFPNAARAARFPRRVAAPHPKLAAPPNVPPAPPARTMSSSLSLALAIRLSASAARLPNQGPIAPPRPAISASTCAICFCVRSKRAWASTRARSILPRLAFSSASKEVASLKARSVSKMCFVSSTSHFFASIARRSR